MNHFCPCKRCVKLRHRKGVVLGTRNLGFWTGPHLTATPQFYFGPVSDYIRHHKFQPGRRPVERFDPRDHSRDY